MDRNNKIYQEQLRLAITTNNFKKLHGKNIMITGATGLIGSCIIDMLVKENENIDANIKIFALVRNIDSAKELFRNYLEKKYFNIIEYDIMNEIKDNINVDYIIHTASNANPVLYSTQPINTILGNIEGIKNILEFGIKNNVKRVVYISSGEIYGEEQEKTEFFDEEYRGYINNLSPRACYPIGKIAAETLCICYSKQYEIETVIVRPCHIYGPTITKTDSRVIAQFIRNAINNEDIIMKSGGKQYRSYCYVIDCVTAILIALTKGQNENAYNIANSNSNITIKDIAELIAKYANKSVVYDLPKDIEKEGYSTVNKTILDDKKMKQLGWKPVYDMNKGIESTIQILKNT